MRYSRRDMYGFACFQRDWCFSIDFHSQRALHNIEELVPGVIVLLANESWLPINGKYDGLLSHTSIKVCFREYRAHLSR